MCQEEVTKEQKKYDVALATRNFEIELFWKRSLFFWGFIASAFVGYATIIKDKESIAILVACFGFVCSVSWSLVNRGSKYWQENWESIVTASEGPITGPLFTRRAEQQKKGIWLRSRKFSVSKVTIALSDFTVLLWGSLLGYHVLKATGFLVCIPKNYLELAPIILSVIFVGFMLKVGRSSDAR